MDHIYPQKFSHGERHCPHWVGGEALKSGERVRKVLGPYTGTPMAAYQPASSSLVDQTVRIAQEASEGWGITPIKERSQILFRFREELYKKMDEIVATKSFESGKTLTEARAGLLKGIEVLEFALSLQNLDAGGKMEVSRGVSCEYRRVPLGVVAGITPFNFPAMVPMWMFPIAIALGNSFIWKPSEKTPMTPLLIAECFQKAGLPNGVFNILQGEKETVDAILEHAGVPAVAFVGSTEVAKAVYRKGTQHLKRVLALGGAKNHIILLPDANPDLATQAIKDSFTGCAGQRCMAMSVLLAVGNVDSIVDRVVKETASLQCGKDMGAIITASQVEFLRTEIMKAEESGAKILLDGRRLSDELPPSFSKGNWIGPTILDGLSETSEWIHKELFGPVLSIIRCKDLSHALRIEKNNLYGNAVSVLTQSGSMAEEVAKRASTGMVGINIGVPVPREPFSFGGFKASKFGHGDITGVNSLNFWTDFKKVTTKWAIQSDSNWMA